MKYLKMLGLAAVAAMALMAFFGASSASAGVLCETHADPCPEGWDLEVGDTITSSLTSGAQAHLSAPFSSVTCEVSHVEGEITRTGGKGIRVEGKITNLTFTSCKCGERTAHVKVTTPYGTLDIDDSTVVRGYANAATVECTGLAKCEFETLTTGTKVGSVTESVTSPATTAELHAEATLTWTAHEGGSSQFVCAGFGDTATWKATYQITQPDALWHSAS